MNYTKDQIDKIGNTLIYLRDKIGYLSKTKALKLLYVLEQDSVRKFGHPLLGLDFEVWKHGPVDRQIFIELTNEEPDLLKDYIALELGFNKTCSIHTKSDFNDDEFSDADLDLMDEVIKQYGHRTAEELVDLTHEKDSLWDKIVNEKLGGDAYWKGSNSSDEKIDLSDLINDDEVKSTIFKNYKENQEIKISLS